MANANSLLLLMGDEREPSLKSAWKGMDKFMHIAEKLQVRNQHARHLQRALMTQNFFLFVVEREARYAGPGSVRSPEISSARMKTRHHVVLYFYFCLLFSSLLFSQEASEIILPGTPEHAKGLRDASWEEIMHLVFTYALHIHTYNIYIL